jgi:NAD(P)H-dependent FMN reductase
MEKPRLTILLGTARKNRQSQKVADYLTSFFKKLDKIEVNLLDVKDFVTPYTIASWDEDALANPWREVASKSSAFILVVPEYNRSFPGELKIVLDSELSAYQNKPVVLAGVSSGHFGGLAAIQSLLPALYKMGFNILPYQLHFPEVEELFSSSEEELDLIYEGKLKQIKEAIYKSLNLSDNEVE